MVTYACAIHHAHHIHTQVSYRDHPRYLEYACKVLRYCMARGCSAAVADLLSQVDTVNNVGRERREQTSSV